jgi:RimJ/RimL family protein N-acetyltransferase
MPTRLPYRFEQPLVTDRLILRLMSAADVDALHAYQSRTDVCRYLPFNPLSRQEVTDRVAQHAQGDQLAADGDSLRLALELGASEDAPGRLIGDSYFSLASTEHSGGEIGWTMHPAFTGRGYATEAATAVLDLAFSSLGLHRVFARLDVRNHASIALCLRLGMREEAHFVQDMRFKDEWSDTGFYAILEEEWRRRRPSAPQS